MMKKFKIFTMFGGILVFMFLSLSSLHAATLNWGDTKFAYRAEVAGDSFTSPSNYVPNGGGFVAYSTENTPLAPISSVANIYHKPDAAPAELSVGAWGGTITKGDGTITNGVSAGAFVSFDVTNLNATEALSYTGSGLSWVVREVTVSSNGLYDLYGEFTGTIDFPAFGVNPETGEIINRPYHASASYPGSVILEEWSGVDQSLLHLNTWQLNIDNMDPGPNVFDESIQMRTSDDNGIPIHYTLKTIIDVDVDICNLMLPMRMGDFPSDIYELGNAENPFVIDGWLVEASHVPVPGTLLLLFSGVTGLFGFKLSLRRRGSSNR